MVEHWPAGTGARYRAHRPTHAPRELGRNRDCSSIWPQRGGGSLGDNRVDILGGLSGRGAFHS